MIETYTKPKLTNHKILYKGKRYWVFEVDKNHPFEGYENDFNYLVFDKCYGGCVILCSIKTEDGLFKGDIQYGQGSIDVEGKTPKELVKNVVDIFNWIAKTEK